MRSHKQLALIGLLLGDMTLSAISARAADLVVATAPPPAQIAVQGAACLRWVWQESSWYDDCWWQRHPYVGRSASFVRRARN